MSFSMDKMVIRNQQGHCKLWVISIWFIAIRMWYNNGKLWVISI